MSTENEQNGSAVKIDLDLETANGKQTDNNSSKEHNSAETNPIVNGSNTTNYTSTEEQDSPKIEEKASPPEESDDFKNSGGEKLTEHLPLAADAASNDNQTTIAQEEQLSVNDEGKISEENETKLEEKSLGETLPDEDKLTAKETNDKHNVNDDLIFVKPKDKDRGHCYWYEI